MRWGWRWRLRAVAWAAVLGAGCADGGSDDGTDTTGGAAATSAAEDSSVGQGSSTGGDASTGVDGTTFATTQGTSADGSSSSGSTPDTDTGFMPPPRKACDLLSVDPSADPTMVIDMGDGAGQIPTVVGEVLLRNCGCHYTDNVTPGEYIDYKSNKVPMATHADFHVPYAGTFPMGYAMQEAWVGIEERVVHHNPLPMPPFPCGMEGMMETITAEDLDVLATWLAAAAPDGANWP
ncbi:MAG: hypothetical protein IPK74_04475 [Deltaproteobacteria bacterium]|nr:hypothetical protein [Deltaproteobacteria bacterium]